MNRLSPITPGELFNKEFLGPLGISQYRLAKAAEFADELERIEPLVNC